ncbi:fibronectin type III domain-containing protein [Anaerocolumna sp. MB42-C2]|uniref:fibronectin type III domain-containing protein n=1 Tax=Anaerocolumna sp. MB42-C2 TaxID=3070997 RepID=UPI0027E024D0|nr:fibronectin type III domain-containing protein [Anaerocolumna sp. MB42-C2]WMJ85922.1 fibronectin type III domain-containing protein [Anaerocolumna sp. MB42-C2]
MFRRFTKTLIISLASISLIGTGIVTNPIVARASSSSQEQLSVFNIFSETADILGVDEQTIVNKIASGSTLGEIAESYNFSETTLLEELEGRIVESINDDLADGTMTQTQASNLKNYYIGMLKLLVENKYISSSNLMSAPGSLTATSKNTTSITLSWGPVSRATSYYVYRATSVSGPYSKITTSATSSFTNTKLANGTTYYYKVKAVNSSGTSPFSSVIKATVGSKSSSLSAPGGLTAAADSDTQISLKWSSVTNASYYYIYRATSSSGTYSKIATSIVTNYTDKNLDDDTTYYYKIKAANSSLESDYSAVKYVSTGDGSDSDSDNPDNLIAYSEEDDEITLEWDEVDDADSYNIYRATSSSGTYSLIANVNGTDYTDDNLSKNKTYYYKIKSVDGSNTSAYSSIAHATTGDDSVNDFRAPRNLDIVDSDEDGITLEWDDVNDAESYYVYRATSKSGTYTKLEEVNDTEYYDYDVTKGKTYYYKVKAYNGKKTSDYSSIVYATAGKDGVDRPDNLYVTDETDDEISLTWDEVEDADYYYVYRATTKSGTYSKVAKVTDTEYTDDHLRSDKTYYYKVKAFDGGKSSDYSKAVSGTTD